MDHRSQTPEDQLDQTVPNRRPLPHPRLQATLQPPRKRTEKAALLQRAERFHCCWNPPGSDTRKFPVNWSTIWFLFFSTLGWFRWLRLHWTADRVWGCCSEDLHRKSWHCCFPSDIRPKAARCPTWRGSRSKIWWWNFKIRMQRKLCVAYYNFFIHFYTDIYRFCGRRCARMDMLVSFCLFLFCGSTKQQLLFLINSSVRHCYNY